MASPLGLTFRPNKDNSTPSTKIGEYKVVDNKAMKSLFGDGQFSPYPTQTEDGSGSVTGIKNAAQIHNNDINDISTESIIRYCADPARPAMKLEYAHFAYLKNLGVYPNNRLIIARRFAAGVANDLTELKVPALATLVSYYPEDQDFFSIKFNELYEEADGGFEEVLNDIGDDILGGDNKGGKLGTGNTNAFGLVPLPALMEGVQLIVGKALGIRTPGQGPGNSPYGNPNVIREARVRKVLKKGAAGSGLQADFTIKMDIEYEQKFINGVDPTLVYMDIIQNALTFGTSEAYFEYSSAFAAGTSGFIRDLISGNFMGIIKTLTSFVTQLISTIGDLVTGAVNKLIAEYQAQRAKNKEKKAAEKAAKEAGTDPPEEEEFAFEIAGLEAARATAQTAISKILETGIGTVISKYKVRLMGIIQALTGAASTPWHVTIGNPKKPMFSSGDLECTGVTLTLGKTLAFNDLPSSIKLTVDFKNARNLGAQEIFNRLNSGKGRSYTRVNKSFIEMDDTELLANEKKKQEELNKDKNKDAQNAQSNINPGAEKPALEKKEETEREKEVAALRAGLNSNSTQGTPTSDGGTPPNNAFINKNDGYIIDNSKTGKLWGSNEPEPALFVAKPQNNSSVPNEPEIKPSNQSENNSPVVTSGLPQQDTLSNSSTPETPGGLESPPQSENVPAKKESKYKYEIKRRGPFKSVVAYDKDGKIVWEGKESFAATEEVLLLEAKINLNDND